jgi:hypothetical protein
MALTRAEIEAAIAPYKERRRPAIITANRLAQHCEDWGHTLAESDLRILQSAIAVLQRIDNLD